MKLLQASLSVSNYLEINFHRCGGPMVFVYPTVHARKVLLRNFHHCGGPAKLVHACLTVKVVFTTVEVLSSSC